MSSITPSPERLAELREMRKAEPRSVKVTICLAMLAAFALPLVVAWAIATDHRVALYIGLGVWITFTALLLPAAQILDTRRKARALRRNASD